MKTPSLFSVIVATTLLMAGCAKMTSCGCDEKTPTKYDPYTPEQYSISWTEFNPLSKFEEYFYYHDSTTAMHDGDTIKVYGYIYPERPVGDIFVELVHGPEDDCTCYDHTLVRLPKDKRVEAWMSEKRRLIYVEGVIEYFGNHTLLGTRTLFSRINAIQYDSVMF